MSNEQYAIIADFPNYAISTYGNVLNIKTGRILKTHDDCRGYDIVNLYNNKIKKHKKIHRLVIVAFLDNPENKPYCDLIDRDKKNNNILNLRFATRSENAHNSSIKKTNTSTCTGVCFEKKTNNWRVKISINGKMKHIGCYDNFDEAVASRKYQEDLHYKEFRAL